MRATVKFSSFGSDLNEIIDRVKTTWSEFSDMEFPRESEILIEESSEMYTAQVTAQVKINMGSQHEQ